MPTSEHPPSSDPFEGTPYRALERLAAGGMGEVFVVQHRQLGRTFVAKALHTPLSRHPQVVDRMRLEAQSLGRLNHPNIVSVSGFGLTKDGRPFLVMEHLGGRTLQEELAERGRLPASEALLIADQLLAGLEAAHGLGIVHRDVKPDNLFLADVPNVGRVLKILDFGVARVLPDAPPTAPRPLAVRTETGAVVGTPRFLSPEAASGSRVDVRADLYGVGLVLYAMLTGRGPFDHLADDDLVPAHALEAPAAPSTIVGAEVSPRLDQIVLRALAKDPAERFQTAPDLRAALNGLAGDRSLGSSPPAPVTTRVAPPLSVPQGSGFGVTDHESDRRPSVRPPRGPSKLVLAVLFLLGLVVSGVGAAALVALLLGRR